MGTPYKYKKQFAEDLPKMFRNGESVAEVCVQLGVSRDSFYYWVNNYPEFKEAYDLGKLHSEAWWSKLGRAGALGERKIQPAVWVFTMKNKFGWRDQPEPDSSESAGQELNINFSVSNPVDDIKVTKGKSE